MGSRTRKALGCAGLLAYLAIYTAAAAAIGVALSPSLPAWALLIYFAIAGLVWVIPLKPMFRWMRGSALQD